VTYAIHVPLPRPIWFDDCRLSIAAVFDAVFHPLPEPIILDHCWSFVVSVLFSAGVPRAARVRHSSWPVVVTVKFAFLVPKLRGTKKPTAPHLGRFVSVSMEFSVAVPELGLACDFCRKVVVPVKFPFK
jgi:hypothetical protein